MVLVGEPVGAEGKGDVGAGWCDEGCQGVAPTGDLYPADRGMDKRETGQVRRQEKQVSKPPVQGAKLPKGSDRAINLQASWAPLCSLYNQPQGSPRPCGLQPGSAMRHNLQDHPWKVQASALTQTSSDHIYQNRSDYLDGAVQGNLLVPLVEQHQAHARQGLLLRPHNKAGQACVTQDAAAEQGEQGEMGGWLNLRGNGEGA